MEDYSRKRGREVRINKGCLMTHSTKQTFIITQRNKHFLPKLSSSWMSDTSPSKKIYGLILKYSYSPPPLFFSFGVQVKHSMSIFTGNSQVFQFRGDNPSSVSSHNLFTVLLFLWHIQGFYKTTQLLSVCAQYGDVTCSAGHAAFFEFLSIPGAVLLFVGT